MNDQLRSARSMCGQENADIRNVIKAMGYSDDDLAAGRPVIGIANSWNTMIPGHFNFRLLSEYVQKGIHRAGGTVFEFCTSCHAEKRGPTLWEHPPVTEDCTTCHDPHGSNNERMLVAKTPFLCQRCHVTSRHPPTVYEGYTLNNSTNANKIYGRSCVVCHQQIHGSNAPSGKAFLR